MYFFVAVFIEVDSFLSFHKLRVTVWSLLSGAAWHIQFPKYPDRGMSNWLLGSIYFFNS